MEIKIGHHIFNANLNSNSSAIKFKALLPLNLNLIELNGNEKYASLPISLPVNHEKVNKIKAGDIMLYGDDTLVIFYKDFSTPYSYTRLGHITDTTALVKALGSGNITVNFR
jgi:hypothetical protein